MLTGAILYKPRHEIGYAINLLIFSGKYIVFWSKPFKSHESFNNKTETKQINRAFTNK